MSSNNEILDRITKLSEAIEQQRVKQQDDNSRSSLSLRTRGRGSHNLTLSNVSTPPYRPQRSPAYPSPPSNSYNYQSSSPGASIPSPHRKLVINQSSSTSTTAQPQSTIPVPSPHRKLVLNQPTSTSTPTTTQPQQSLLIPSPHRKLVNNTSSSSSSSYSSASTMSSYGPKTSAETHSPKVVTVNGVKFISKGKTMIREGCTVKPRKVFKSPRPAHKISVFGTVPRRGIVRGLQGHIKLIRNPDGYLRRGLLGKSLVLNTKKVTIQHCGFFTRYGKCPNADQCFFKHDPNHVAICPRFLLNKCPKPSGICRLSHTPTPFIMPHCVHFQYGRCTNADCLFSHVRVRKDAPVCRMFATQGFCGKGTKCPHKHVHVCPEYAETAKCSNPKCRLPHLAKKTDGEAKGVSALVRPTSWISTDYIRSMKQKHNSLHSKSSANTMDTASGSHYTESSDDEDDQDMDEDKLAEEEAIDEDEEDEVENQDGFVRLFDESDDEGWSQYQMKDDETDGTSERMLLRFSEDTSSEEEDSDTENDADNPTENMQEDTLTSQDG